MNHEDLKKQAKEIMDHYMEAMKDIKLEDDFVLERDQCFREEGEGNEGDADFRERFLSNAPNSTQDAIVANKGAWTK